MAAKRKAPKGGYDFKEKALYRHRVWTEFRRRCPVKPAVANAFLMPSSEGAEIEVALKAGFREHNLYVCDSNAAIVAHLKRRYSKINTYGVTADRACERIAAEGKVLHVANFDFTSCVGKSFYEGLKAIRESGAVSSKTVWAITLLRGRELFLDERIDEFIDAATGLDTILCAMGNRCAGEYELLPRDILRLGCAAAMKYNSDDTVSRLGIYRSGKQTMLWAVFCPIRETQRYARSDVWAYVALVNSSLALGYGVEDVPGQCIDEILEVRRKYLEGGL